MARSTYIYVVIRSVPRGHAVEAAFTVKHELATWMGRQSLRNVLRVFRVRDGGDVAPVEMDVKELLDEPVSPDEPV